MAELTELKSWLWLDYAEIESTNDEAYRISKDILPGQKIVITTQRQTKGRGRRGRNWISLEGNLFMSQVFCWPLKENNALPLIVSLAVLNTVLQLSPHAHVRLKWPNDVLLNNCKLSGILLERGEKDSIIIGIGVNVKHYPEASSLLYPSTSLSANDIDIDRTEFLKLYLDEFDKLIQIYTSKGMSTIVSMWLNHAKGLNSPIVVRTQHNELTGIFKGLDSDGMLQLKTIDDKVVSISAGDVFFDENGENKK